ncbi:MAG: FkbM family methyltransferase [Candidatus Hermodarchaeota archaeon]|nr:FkbM family methyltransferase [Candidatus Hermodarchaeota archaeon]
MTESPTIARSHGSIPVPKLGEIPILVLGFLLLIVPVRISKTLKDYAGKVSFHEYLHHVCNRLHLLNLLPRIESTLFRFPTMYEGELASCLANTSGNLFVDIGANVGRYTLLLGHRYDEVIAIEPTPDTFTYLKANVAQASLSNVQCLQCAVSNQVGTADFHLAESAESHSLVKTHANGHRVPGTDRIVGALTGKKITVPTQTLATILKDRSADLVKVDVEGAEWLVLEGAKPVVKQVRSWCVELHDWEEEGKKEELEAWFTSRGYKCSWLQHNHIYAYQP